LVMTRQSLSQQPDLVAAANLISSERRGRRLLHSLNLVPIN